LTLAIDGIEREFRSRLRWRALSFRGVTCEEVKKAGSENVQGLQGLEVLGISGVKTATDVGKSLLAQAGTGSPLV